MADEGFTRPVYRDEGGVGLEVVSHLAGTRSTSWVRVMDGRPGAVCVVTHDGRILIGSHPRPAVGQDLLEFPRGMGEPGEAAEQTAVRELAEESGLRGVEARHVGTIFADSGLLANAVAVVEVAVDDPTVRVTPGGEFTRLEWVSPDALCSWIGQGRVLDGITLAAFVLWQQRA